MPDASKLSFPVQMVIAIVTGAIALYGALYGAQFTLRSDVRDIKTQQELQVKIQELQVKLQDERARQISDSIATLTRGQSAQQYEIANIQIALAAAGVKLK